MKKKLLVLGVVLATIIAIGIPFLSSCATPTPEPTPTPTAEPIKLGAPAPLTGYMASDGMNMRDGMLMAVEDLNAAGGILGRPVEIIFFDSKELLAETAAACADKLILQDGVDAIITGYWDEPGTDTFGKYEVPFMHSPGSQACIDLIVDNGYTNVFLSTIMGDVLAAEGIKTTLNLAEIAGHEWPNNKMYVVNGPWPWSYDNAIGAIEAAEAAGWDVVGQSEVALETREWGGTLAGIRAEQPAIIFMEAWDTGCESSFDIQFQEDPWNCIIVHSQSALMPDFLDIMGSKANGIVTLSKDTAIPGPESDAWYTRFEERFGREAGLSMTAGCYDKVMHWAAAVEQVGDPKDYAAVCNTIKNLHYEGLNGTYIFTDEYYCPDPMNLAVIYFQFQDAETVPVGVFGEPVPGSNFQIPPWIQ